MSCLKGFRRIVVLQDQIIVNVSLLFAVREIFIMQKAEILKEASRASTLSYKNKSNENLKRNKLEINFKK